MRVELDVPLFREMEDLSISPNFLNMSRRLYPNTLNLYSFESSISESNAIVSAAPHEAETDLECACADSKLAELRNSSK